MPVEGDWDDERGGSYDYLEARAVGQAIALVEGDPPVDPPPTGSAYGTASVGSIVPIGAAPAHPDGAVPDPTPPMLGNSTSTWEPQ